MTERLFPIMNDKEVRFDHKKLKEMLY